MSSEELYHAFFESKADFVESEIFEHFDLSISIKFTTSLSPLDFLVNASRKTLEVWFAARGSNDDDMRSAIYRFLEAVPILKAIAGRCSDRHLLFSLGDAGNGNAIGFCSNRPEACLVADTSFVSSKGYADVRQYFQNNPCEWSSRSDKLFWRGSTTGLQSQDDDFLPRVKLCLLGQNQNAIFDTKIVGIVQMQSSEQALIENLNIHGEHVHWSELVKYKYHADIDGNTNSWSGLFCKLLSGGLVFKIESPHGFRQWYYDQLKDGYNYISVKSDLSNLVEKYSYYSINQEEALEIAKRGQDLASSLLYEEEIIRSADSIVAFSRSSFDAAASVFPENNVLIEGSPVSAEEVKWLFRLLLERRPENKEVAEAFRWSFKDTASAVSFVINSDEFKTKQSGSNVALSEKIRQAGVDIEVAKLGLCGQMSLEISSPPIPCPIRVCVSRRAGRFGNNFFQIVNAAMIADALESPFVKIPQIEHVRTPSILELRSGNLIPLEKSDATCADLSADFYMPFGFESCFFSDVRSRLLNICAKMRTSLYQDIVGEKDGNALAVHFRGGDVFDVVKPVHGGYLQPPFAFYKAAITHALKARKFVRIDLVSEDRLNPALALVEQFLATSGHKFESSVRSKREDFTTMSRATVIVASNSTFVEVPAVLSAALEEVYSFRTFSSQEIYKPFAQSRIGMILEAKGVRGYLCNDVSGTYIGYRNWCNSDHQRQILCGFPDEHIRLFRAF